MTLAEFTAAVEARGYEVPAGATGQHGGYDGWLDYLGFSRGTPGAPGHRTYTQGHVDLVVAWQRILDLTGSPDASRSYLHRQAARMLAMAPCGYVYIHQCRVRWALCPPLVAMRTGATVWPVGG